MYIYGTSLSGAKDKLVLIVELIPCQCLVAHEACIAVRDLPGVGGGSYARRP